MNAQRRLGLVLSWPWLTAVFLADVVVLVLASHLPAPWWVGFAVAGVATIVSVLTYRGVPLISALAGWAWDWSSVPEAALLAGRIPSIDHQRRFGRAVVGVHEYQGQLVAVIAVDARADAPSGRHLETSLATLPVEVVAAGLRQFDVRLDAIDIVSVWTRHVAEAADSSAPDYAEVADNAPTGGRRSTWLVLRMNPQHNVAAVVARDSVASTLAAAAERLAHDLDGRRCVARPLTGVELAEVATAVLAGLQPAWNRPGWRYLKHLNGYVKSFWVSPQDITSETLERLWRPDTDATVVTIRVTAPHDRAEVSAWVRYHSTTKLHKDVWTGLNPLTGRQLAAVRASLPAPTTRPPLRVPGRVLRDGEQLLVPVGRASVGLASQQMSAARE
jgi:type VII secretion protein EccE